MPLVGACAVAGTGGAGGINDERCMLVGWAGPNESNKFIKRPAICTQTDRRRCLPRCLASESTSSGPERLCGMDGERLSHVSGQAAARRALVANERCGMWYVVCGS